MIISRAVYKTITCWFLLGGFVSSCFDSSEQAALPTPTEDISALLDRAAETFVKLGLELGEYDADYVDAYLGPPQWQAEAQAKLRSKQQLSAAIAQLLEELAGLTPPAGELVIRRKSLFRNVRAMDARVRMSNGESFSFAEEARLIYDVELPAYDFTYFDQALEEIAALFPGSGELSDRVNAFKDSLSIPQQRLEAVVDQAIAECRRRTMQYIDLPAGEGFILEYVTDKSWSGYNWYQGDNESLMQINVDFPLKIDRPIELGCHEGYPGHHVWNILVENELLRNRAWIEFSLFPLFSPYGLIGEGSANYGIELAFPDDEKMAFEQAILYPMAGLDPELAETWKQLSQLTEKLSHAQTATAQLYLDGDISREQAIEQRRKYGLSSRARAEQSVRFIEQYRAYVLNYSLGKDIVANFIESQGAGQDSRWQAFEKLLTDLLTASDMID